MTDILKENITEAINNGTGKTPSSPEGIAVAYGSLVIMALLPIFFGSLRSVKHKVEVSKRSIKANETASRIKNSF